MIVQNEHSVRTAAAGVERRLRLGGPAQVASGKHRHGLRPDARQLREEVVDRLQRAVCRGAEDLVAAILQLSRKQRDAQVDRLLKIGWQLRQHRETAGHMKAADGDPDTGGAQRASQIEGSRVLIRLYAREDDQAEMTVASESLDEPIDADAGVDLVHDRDVDGDLGSQGLAIGGIPEQAVEHRQRVRRDDRTHPLDDVAVVVVM